MVRGSSVSVEEWADLQRRYQTLEATYWKEKKAFQVEVANLSAVIENLQGEISKLQTISSLAPVIPILNQKWAQEDLEIQSLLRPLVLSHLLNISYNGASSS